MPPLRIVFCGTPAFAVPALRELDRDSQILRSKAWSRSRTAPRDAAARFSTSPVKAAALAAGIPVYQPENPQ